MKSSPGTLAFGLLLSVAIPSGVALAVDASEQLMLERADYWRSQQRPDLAGNILDKLLALNPSQPDALYQQGVLALAGGDREDADRYFDRLRLLAATSSRAAQLAAMAKALPPVASAPAVPATAAAIATIAQAGAVATGSGAPRFRKLCFTEQKYAARSTPSPDVSRRYVLTKSSGDMNAGSYRFRGRR